MLYWVFLAAVFAFVLLALFSPALTRPGLVVASLLASLCFAAFLRPFDGALGNYSESARQFARGKDVWVPVNFKAKEEGFVFFLPGAKVHPYTYDRNVTAAALAAKYPLFAIRQPITSTNVAGRIVGERLELGSRHTSSQIREMLQGKIYEHLFLKELLIESADAPANPPKDERR